MCWDFIDADGDMVIKTMDKLTQDGFNVSQRFSEIKNDSNEVHVVISW